MLSEGLLYWYWSKNREGLKQPRNKDFNLIVQSVYVFISVVSSGCLENWHNHGFRHQKHYTRAHTRAHTRNKKEELEFLVGKFKGHVSLVCGTCSWDFLFFSTCIENLQHKCHLIVGLYYIVFLAIKYLHPIDARCEYGFK